MMDTDLFVQVRAIESRRHLVEKNILPYIPQATVYYDHSGNGMTGFLGACKAIGSQPCLTIEDDVILTSDFMRKALEVITQKPDTFISFFSLSKKLTESHWKKGSQFCATLAVYMPAGLAKACIDKYPLWQHYDRFTNPTAFDFLVGYAWGPNKLYYVHCPSLVQHIIGKSAIDPRRSSKRVSVTFRAD